MSAGRDKYLRLLIVAALVVIADQLSKWWVLSAIEPHSAIPVVPGFFNLVRVHNPGGAFGFLAGHSASWRGLFFIFFSLVAVGLLLWLYKQTPAAYKKLLTGFSLILGGALGNLIDRLRFGRVVDFLDLHVGTWHWPAFNVADSAITVGMLIFGFYLLTRKYPV